MTKHLWITDAHLDHLSPTLQDAWLEKLANSPADMLLLGGDTADSRVFFRLLGRIREAFPKQIALVAGNHDYYHSSISQFRQALAELHAHGVIVWEPGCQSLPVIVEESVYLCGSGGWGDCSAGFAKASGMSLNDEYCIEELRQAPDLTALLRNLGQESANHLQAQLEAIPADAKSVIILTHVPPWPEACWHQGRRSDFLALPRFCWQAGGKVISQAAAKMPQTHFLVLCGHTHSEGFWEEKNITCHTAGAVYGEARHAGMVESNQAVRVKKSTN
jgi:predicted phosphodiesterase